MYKALPQEAEDKAQDKPQCASKDPPQRGITCIARLVSILEAQPEEGWRQACLHRAQKRAEAAGLSLNGAVGRCGEPR